MTRARDEVVKGPPCSICGLVDTVTWVGNECRFPTGWVLGYGLEGFGAFCPEHDSQAHDVPLVRMPSSDRSN